MFRLVRGPTLALAIASLLACGGNVRDAGPVDATTDTDATVEASADVLTSETAAGHLVFVLTFPSFTYCRCHHGAGPGIDGMAGLTITNPTTTPIRLKLVRFTLGPTKTAPTYTTEGSGSVLLRDSTGSFDAVTIEPGATAIYTVVVYIDTPVDSPPSVPYRISLAYTEDGGLERTFSPPDTFSIPAVD